MVDQARACTVEDATSELLPTVISTLTATPAEVAEQQTEAATLSLPMALSPMVAGQPWKARNHEAESPSLSVDHRLITRAQLALRAATDQAIISSPHSGQGSPALLPRRNRWSPGTAGEDDDAPSTPTGVDQDLIDRARLSLQLFAEQLRETTPPEGSDAEIARHDADGVDSEDWDAYRGSASLLSHAADSDVDHGLLSRAQRSLQTLLEEATRLDAVQREGVAQEELERRLRLERERGERALREQRANLSPQLAAREVCDDMQELSLQLSRSLGNHLSGQPSSDHMSEEALTPASPLPDATAGITAGGRGVQRSPSGAERSAQLRAACVPTRRRRPSRSSLAACVWVSLVGTFTLLPFLALLPLHVLPWQALPPARGGSAGWLGFLAKAIRADVAIVGVALQRTVCALAGPLFALHATLLGAYAVAALVLTLHTVAPNVGPPDVRADLGLGDLGLGHELGVRELRNSASLSACSLLALLCPLLASGTLTHQLPEILIESFGEIADLSPPLIVPPTTPPVPAPRDSAGALDGARGSNVALGSAAPPRMAARVSAPFDWTRWMTQLPDSCLAAAGEGAWTRSPNSSVVYRTYASQGGAQGGGAQGGSVLGGAQPMAAKLRITYWPPAARVDGVRLDGAGDAAALGGIKGRREARSDGSALAKTPPLLLVLVPSAPGGGEGWHGGGWGEGRSGEVDGSWRGGMLRGGWRRSAVWTSGTSAASTGAAAGASDGLGVGHMGCHLRHARSLGFAVATAQFRPLMDSADGSALLDDVLSAVGSVRQRARAWGFDADRLLLMGSGGGGHLALTAAYTLNARARRRMIHSVVALGAPTDMALSLREPRLLGAWDEAEAVRRLCTGEHATPATSSAAPSSPSSSSSSAAAAAAAAAAAHTIAASSTAASSSATSSSPAPSSSSFPSPSSSAHATAARRTSRESLPKSNQVKSSHVKSGQGTARQGKAHQVRSLRGSLLLCSKLSPLRLVTKHAPRTLLYHSTRDSHFAVGHARALQQALDQAGVPHALVEVPLVPSGSEGDESSWPGQLFRYAFDHLLRAALGRLSTH